MVGGGEGGVMFFGGGLSVRFCVIGWGGGVGGEKGRALW